ncbi:hypothetical protein JZO78_11445 [Enterococcus ureilyticus]|uniref:hypothetical protein n=1 Tax=Enterococcus ureilyticus TaxID=1131292 RepID=UPI001A930FEB|nr:hypothetical protein [Enterococcus ureilyticus]MBO0446960.1 hypothetical protein [Enterococcus ureilyticus]
MSNYYYLVKKRISATYDLLGWGDKVFYYFIMFIGLVAVIGFFNTSQSYKQDEATGLFYLGLGFASYFGSKYWRNRIAKERWEKTKKFSQDDFVTLDSVNSLIDELEKSLSSLKTVSQWAVGVLTTLIVLISTLMGNAIFKVIDIALKVLKDEDIEKISDIFVKEYNNSGSSIFEIILGNAGNLLLLFVSLIALGYFAFSTLSFIKKQVLGLLYDVRYHLLLKSTADENDSEM